MENEKPKGEHSQIEDDPDWYSVSLCRDPEHRVPTAIHIPPGKRLRHVCPTCGQVTLVRPCIITC